MDSDSVWIEYCEIPEGGIVKGKNGFYIKPVQETSHKLYGCFIDLHTGEIKDFSTVWEWESFEIQW